MRVGGGSRWEVGDVEDGWLWWVMEWRGYLNPRWEIFWGVSGMSRALIG